MTFKIILVLLAVAQMLDGYTTYKGIASGKAKEGNPVLGKIQNWLSNLGWTSKWNWLIASKVLCTGLIAALWFTPETILSVAAALLALAGSIYVLVNNYKIITK